MKTAATADSPTMEKMASVSPRIAPFLLPMPCGMVSVGQVSDAVVVKLPADPAIGEHRVGIVLYDAEGTGGRAIGMLSACTPGEARSIAAALLRIANQISPVNPS